MHSILVGSNFRVYAPRLGADGDKATEPEVDARRRETEILKLGWQRRSLTGGRSSSMVIGSVRISASVQLTLKEAVCCTQCQKKCIANARAHSNNSNKGCLSCVDRLMPIFVAHLRNHFDKPLPQGYTSIVLAFVVDNELLQSRVYPYCCQIDGTEE